ncbi:MAG: mechanosensitive ion channel [Bacteroidetes bacterium]|jgi:small conductance mechanosensitive channel|nr:mechanosensitive ion channel [Bacteroidota bacterium]
MPDWISIDLVTQYAVKIGGAILFLLIAWIIAGAVGRFTRRSLEKSKLDLTLTKFFGNLAKYVVLIMALVACLGIFGIETTSFAAVIGAAGLAIGLAFQGTLGNFSAGIMLLVFRPFKVGDVVNVNGTTAKVTEIELFTTLLDTPDNRRIIMPNGSIFGNTIENITHHPTRRVDVAVGTDYGASLKEARDVMMRVAENVEGGLSDPAPQVYLQELGGSSINWAVRVWANTPDYWAVRERLTQEVKEALDEAGIGIPFPQMDVHFDPDVSDGFAGRAAA